MLLQLVLKALVKNGALAMVDAAGREYRFGSSNVSKPITMRLHDRRLEASIVFRPHLALGEAYMDGRLTIENGDIYDLLDLVASNLSIAGSLPFDRLRKAIGWVARTVNSFNWAGISRERAKANVAHHYDLSGELYRLFLDDDGQYSCAYFASPDDTLETAQLNKKRHIAAKLYLNRPDLKILDIGSGWGGLGLFLAQEATADVTGITLSEEQHKVSNERAKKAKLSNCVRFDMRDYREVAGQFDRIVSVGMFEHVGRRNYPDYFHTIRDLLTTDGVAMVHSIGFFDGPKPISPFIRKYIFPGAEIPSLSEVLAVVERAGLLVTDVEVLRLHYAETLRAWRERFVSKWDRVAELYDERFCRMWLFYLALCEIGFRHRTMMVFQIQMAKRVDAVPLTRDYIYEWEQRHRRRELAA